MHDRFPSRRPTLDPVSIVIPTLNEARFLPGLLESLSRAGSRPLEVIVVDGHSDDATCEVVERFRDAAPPHMTVRLLGSPVRNISIQRNLGAELARHETILFVAADVVIERPEDLELLINRFRGEHLAAASCRFRPIEHDPRAEVCYALLYGFHKCVERWDPHAMGACIITTRDVFRYCGGFDPRLRINEDANFCRKASCLGRFRILPVSVRVSASRFARRGYLRMVLRYLRIYLDRRLHGEAYGGSHAYVYGRDD